MFHSIWLELVAQLGEHLQQHVHTWVDDAAFAGGAATVVGIIVRAWVAGKLRDLALLKKHRQDDRVWKALARQRIGAQDQIINTLRDNDHNLRNFCTTLAMDVHSLADKLELSHEPLEPPKWQVTHLPVGELPAEIIESGEDGQEPE